MEKSSLVDTVVTQKQIRDTEMEIFDDREEEEEEEIPKKNRKIKHKKTGEVDMQIFPQEVALGIQVEFYYGTNIAFFCSSDEAFITSSKMNGVVPFKVAKTRLSGVQLPVKGIVSIVLKIYYNGNFIRDCGVGDENYNFLNERLIPKDLTAKPANSKKRTREPDHEIEWANLSPLEEDMEVVGVSNIKKWTKKNYANFAELSLVVQNIGTTRGICELIEYECVVHIENKEMQDYILSEIKRATL